MIKNKLPVYEAKILSGDDGIMAISLVDNPAIQIDFMYFKDQAKEKLNLAYQEDQKIVTGPVLVPDKLIYRRDPDGTEYYIKFSKETIRLAAMKMIQEGTVNNNTLMHLPGYISGLIPVEIYLARKDSDWPEGSLIVSYKVTSDQIWSEVKAGTFRGFSLEGFFELTQSSKDIQEISDLVNQIKSRMSNLG